MPSSASTLTFPALSPLPQQQQQYMHHLRTCAPAAANSSNNNNMTDSPHAEDAAEGTTLINDADVKAKAAEAKREAAANKKKEKFAAAAAKGRADAAAAAARLKAQIAAAAEAEAAKEDKAKGKAKTPKGELVDRDAPCDRCLGHLIDICLGHRKSTTPGEVDCRNDSEVASTKCWKCASNGRACEPTRGTRMCSLAAKLYADPTDRTTALELKKLRAAAKERAKKAKSTPAAAAASTRGSRAATSREVASLSRRIRRANKLATRQLALSEQIARRLCAEDFVPLPPLSDEEMTEEDESEED
ncbi:uncharacterized protein J7T54_005474 [Emericellopsis cladophorae]|uniref:Uncharacterized protein n=1 Tax=Emericellopsis cladophorae TaxID=2686198 RepID=A0A9Q0BAE1_9HYPO|nr:uncharacterized protein J7T54_005474 [Emericellopsis cladophorae]KAI6777681.1 hypothetical protein J7T54_005474 [Emericellopsis cladophorae]